MASNFQDLKKPIFEEEMNPMNLFLIQPTLIKEEERSEPDVGWPIKRQAYERNQR